MIGVQIDEHLEGAQDFADQLAELRIPVTIPSPLEPGMPAQSHEGIAIGCSLPCEIVVPIVKMAVARWPSLKYLFLSSDHQERRPQSIHYELYLGAPTEFFLARGCRPWPAEAFNELCDELPITVLHLIIRSYYQEESPSTPVRYVGGPLDGEEQNIPGPPGGLFKRLRTYGKALYELHETQGGCEYHFVANAAPGR